MDNVNALRSIAEMPINLSVEQIGALQAGIKALQEQAEREKGCGIVYRHRYLGQFKYKTCPNCGEKIEIEHPTKIDAPYCGNCGKVILDAEQQYCGWCGKRLK